MRTLVATLVTSFLLVGGCDDDGGGKPAGSGSTESQGGGQPAEGESKESASLQSSPNGPLLGTPLSQGREMFSSTLGTSVLRRTSSP